MTQMMKTVEDVRAFWDANPLLTGELEELAGTEAWFRAFDRIKNDLFAGDLSDWVPSDLGGKKMLDIGCGPGYWNRIFGKMNVEYHGIDISPRSVGMAERSREIFGLRGDLRVGNAERLDFADGTFDFVLSEGVIHHTPDTEACVREIFRVLKKGGTARVGLYYKSAVLRSPVLFGSCLWVMRLLKVGLKGRGREKMAAASSPEEFVRIYDGADNPIGKAYTRGELRKMFGSFSRIEMSRYYFPQRALPVRMPRFFQKVLNSLFGTMILVKLQK